MLDRVLRSGDCELVKQRNKLKNCQTNYRTKLHDKSSSPEACKTTVQFSALYARNSSRDSQTKLIVRFVVKWREFREKKNIYILRQLWSATQDSRNALNRSRTGKNSFFNWFVQISGRIWTVVRRGYVSHASSHSENVTSARRVRQK